MSGVEEKNDCSTLHWLELRIEDGLDKKFVEFQSFESSIITSLGKLGDNASISFGKYISMVLEIIATKRTDKLYCNCMLILIQILSMMIIIKILP